MTPAQFHAVALDLLKNYWRIKAANALQLSSPDIATGQLEYSNVPNVGVAINSFAAESVADALSALQTFLADRLPRDLFFALIAEFETRLVTRLLSLGDTGEGTLGQLQTRLEQRLPVPAGLSQDLKEIRERRNAMTHNHDLADHKYVLAAAAVLPRATPYVTAVVTGANVSPGDQYLAYSADALVRYSNHIG